MDGMKQTIHTLNSVMDLLQNEIKAGKENQEYLWDDYFSVNRASKVVMEIMFKILENN